MDTFASPVRLTGHQDEGLSRWLWLVKWLLLIPHGVVLAVLWPVFVVLTAVAWVSILVTGRYPRAVFDVNLGILRWTWRVSFYAYSALGTDRYPPFSLGEEPDYPARLDVAPPGDLSRWRALVKPVLALPHILIAGLFAGGGGWVLMGGEAPWGGGIVGMLVVVGGLLLLVTGVFPRGLFDIVLGLDRWVVRVAAYVALMTDAYPPFRLDLGGDEPGTVAVPVDRDDRPGSAPTAPGSTQTATLVAGGIAALLAVVLLVSGAAATWADRTQRDAGYLMSGTHAWSSPTYALASERVDLRGDGPAGLAPDDLVGDVRVVATSDRPLFIGIARTDDAAAYLRGVEHDIADDLGHAVRDVRRRAGGRPATPPGEAGIWAAATTGTGRQQLDWTARDGAWTVVAMDPAGGRGVEARVAVGAELDVLGTVGLVLLLLGAACGGVAALLLVLGRRRP